MWTLALLATPWGCSEGLVWGVQAWEVVQHAWHHLPWTPVRGRVRLLLLQRSWRTWKGRAGRCCKGCVTKEGFQGGWTAPASEFTAAQPEVTDWSEGAGALRVYWAVSYWRLARSAGHWWLVCGPQCSGHPMGRNSHWVVLSCSSTDP